MLQWLQDIVIVAFDLDNGQNAARNIIRDISPLFNDVGRIHKFSYQEDPSRSSSQILKRSKILFPQ